MDFRILGPLEVVDAGRQLQLGGSKQRAVLAMLVLNANHMITSDRLIARLWDDEPPRSAVGTLQTYISHLRNALEPGRARGAAAQVLVTRAPGYLLRARPDEVDALRFERLVAEGRAALKNGDLAVAAARFRAGLELWRGPALADFAGQAFAVGEITRLENLRLDAMEGRVESELQRGRHAELVGELERLVADHPLREDLRVLLMVALYRTGRQADALAVYQDAHRLLVDELGLDPSERLKQLEQAVLRHAPDLDWTESEQPQRPPSVTATASGTVTPSPPPVFTVDFFVGREAELGQLRAALTDARTGQTRLVLIAGEPGIGKSRLANELTDEARAEGVEVLWGRAWEEDGAPTYWPWVQVARSWMADRTPEHLRQALGDEAAAMEPIIPDIGDRLPNLPALPPLEPAQARFRLFAAVTSWLRRATAEQPLTVVLDDLHRVDTPSLLLLRFLAREAVGIRLLILATHRDRGVVLPAPFVQALAQLIREPVTRRIDLGGLAEHEVARFVELATGLPAPQVQVQSIHQRTTGNPLFVGELVRLLHSRQRLDRPEQLVDPSDDIPQAVVDLVRARVEELTGATKDALAVASVLGREFDVGVLASITGETAHELLEQLEEAAVAGIVTEAPEYPGRYRFTHILVRDALYGQLPASRRTALHRQVGEALEALHGHDLGPHLAELAHHFQQGAHGLRDDRALAYMVRAGERAMALIAYEEAARLFEVALLQPIDAATRCDLLLALADAQTKAGATARARETLLEAAESAKAIGAPEALARAALGFGAAFDFTLGQAAVTEHFTRLLEASLRLLGPDDSPLRAQVLGRLAMALYWVAPAEEPAARRRRDLLSAEAVMLARRLGDDAVLAQVLNARCFATWGPDTLMDRIELSTEVLRLSGGIGQQELVLDGRRWQIVSHMEAVDVPAMERALQVFTRGASQLRQPLYLYWSAILRSSRELLYGRLEEAERLSFDALAIGERLEDQDTTEVQNGVGAQIHAIRREQGRMGELEPLAQAFAEQHPEVPAWRMGLAMIHASTDQLDAARVHFDFLARDGFAHIPRDAVWLAAMAGCAEVCAALGDLDRAVELYELLLPYRRRFVVISFGFAFIGSVAHFLGQLAAVTGRWDQAKQHFEAAIQVHAQIGAMPALARTRHEYAQMLLGRGQAGDRERAGALLAQATDSARQLGMARLLERAEAASEDQTGSTR
jgi:DNA-binding SARP family transcriptional activator